MKKNDKRCGGIFYRDRITNLAELRLFVERFYPIMKPSYELFVLQIDTRWRQLLSTGGAVNT